MAIHIKDTPTYGLVANLVCLEKYEVNIVHTQLVTYATASGFTNPMYRLNVA